ncbi:cell division protein ZapA [Aureibaculum algae]|uniref:Cell division protein ZapA n=2 Tax=Aureibaculum TaxID=2706948 RepID=A0A5B7TYG2_9FLAO|nr:MULTISPECIES: cell division protein ZapA [Aureibaculum]MBJ2175473.1 cell division protein ZapA [Aureibaculum flavum]QCX39827.1 cell division protein ZapA [Aureibaculum algae]
MEDKLKIKVTIGDRVYPLTINSEGEEEGVRKAVKKINDLIKRFEENYEVRDKQDVLAMCALQFASLQEVKSIYNDQDGEEIEKKLLEMSEVLDAHL